MRIKTVTYFISENGQHSVQNYFDDWVNLINQQKQNE